MHVANNIIPINTDNNKNPNDDIASDNAFINICKPWLYFVNLNTLNILTNLTIFKNPILVLLPVYINLANNST